MEIDEIDLNRALMFVQTLHLYFEGVALKLHCLLDNRSCPPNQLIKQTTFVVTTAFNQGSIDYTEMETWQIFPGMSVVSIKNIIEFIMNFTKIKCLGLWIIILVWVIYCG